MAQIFDNPSDNVYDAYGKAVAAGQLYNDNLRRNTAFNALAKAYGPEAGDPTLATSLNTLAQAKAMDPLLVQQQSLQNAGLQQDQAFKTANNPSLIANNKTVADTNANALDRTKQVQRAQEVHTALSGAITSLGTSLNGVEDPNQRLAMFDAQVDQIAPLIGTDPTQLKHQLAQYRAAVATQGAAALPQLQQQLDSAIESGLTPEERQSIQTGATNLAIQQSKLEQQRTKTAQTAASGGLTPAQKIAQDKVTAATNKAKVSDAAGYADFSSGVDNIAAPGGAIDDAIAYIKAHPDSYGFAAKGIKGIGMADVAGTPANQLAAKLNPITANVLLDKLKDLKASSKNGSSGFGALSEREGETLRTSIASVDQGQPGSAIIASLEKVRAAMLGSKNRLNQIYRASYAGEDPTEVLKITVNGGAETAADGAGAAPAAAGQSYTYNPATGELE